MRNVDSDDFGNGSWRKDALSLSICKARFCFRFGPGHELRLRSRPKAN